MKPDSNFGDIAHNAGETTFVHELWSMLRANKKYWLMPMVIVLLLLGVLVMLSSTAAAPFVYTLF